MIRRGIQVRNRSSFVAPVQNGDVIDGVAQFGVSFPERRRSCIPKNTSCRLSHRFQLLFKLHIGNQPGEAARFDQDVRQSEQHPDAAHEERCRS